MNLKKTIFFFKINKLMKKKEINYLLLDYNYFSCIFIPNFNLIYYKLNIYKFKIKKNYNNHFFIQNDKNKMLFNNTLFILIFININAIFIFINILILLKIELMSLIINIEKKFIISEKKINFFFKNHLIKLSDLILNNKNFYIKKKFFFFQYVQFLFKFFFIKLYIYLIKKFKVIFFKFMINLI